MRLLKLRSGAGKLFTCLAVLAALCGLLGVVNPGPASALTVQGLAEGYITTVAGDGTNGYSGDGGPATSAKIGFPYKIAVDSAGNLFIAYKGATSSEGYRVFEVAAETGTQYGIPMVAGNIYTVAGDGTNGYSGDGGPAIEAQISSVECLVVDSDGNLYIGGGYRVRMVDPDGTITTVAGTGTSGTSGDGYPATSASTKISTLKDMAVDGAGNLFMAFGARIRMVAAETGMQYGIDMSAGNIYTVAGTNFTGNRGDGGPATSARITPAAVAVDDCGNIYIASLNLIRKVDPSGIITTSAQPTADGMMLEIAGMAMDGAGNIYISNYGKHCVYQVDPSGAITVAGNGTGGYSGDGGPAAGAQLYLFTNSGLAVDSAGNLYIADTSNHRVRYVQIAPVSPPKLATLSLSGSPVLYYTGAPLAFNLGELTLAGADQYGAVFDLSGQTVTWAVYSGPAMVSGSVLTITGSGTVSVAASVYGVTSNTLDLSVGAGSSELSTLTLSGSPALNYSGVPLTYDLDGLTLVGADQSGAVFDLSGKTLTWAVYSGPATISGGLLTITGSDTVSVTASVYGVTSNILRLTVASPPAVTADTTDNIAGQDMELTFTDDLVWRGAISEISVDGAALNSGAYLKSAGKITIKSYVFTTSRDYDIVIKAAGYADARVTQTLFALAITGDGVAIPVTLTLDQLQGMQQYRYVYSVINTWPTKNWYVGEGVKLKDLFAQAGIKEDAKLINVIASDGYRMTFTVQELLKDQRYYFPHFMDNEYAGEIPGSSTGAQEVETILALKSAGSNNFGDMTVGDALHLIIGQRAVTEQMNDKYVKHVSKIEVLTTAPEKWDTPQATPGSGVVPAGTLVRLSSAHMDTDKIYYTTDGSTPTVNSLMYNWIARRWWSSREDELDSINQAIEIKKNTTIKAVTIGPGKVCSDIITFSYQVPVAAPPDLTPDTSDNSVGRAVELAFTDDTEWREAISEISVDGAALGAGQYSKDTAGKITISEDVFTTAKDYAIVIKADGYTDASVTQTIFASIKTPPALTADTAGNTMGQPVALTFADDAEWREAISEISVDGAVLAAGKYSIEAGKITVSGDVFTTVKDYSIVIKAAGYNNAAVPQTITGELVEKKPLLTWSGDPKTTQTITWLMPNTCATAEVQYLKEDGFTGSFAAAREAEAIGRAFGTSGTNNLFSVNLTGLEPGTRYVYRVGAGEDWSQERIFTTARDTDKFSFLYLGDVHAGYSAGWGSQWDDMLESAYDDYPGLKFSLQGGDVSDEDNETDYRQLIGAATKLFSQISFMPAMGNHDSDFYLDFFTLPENGPAGLEERFYSFDYGNAHFAVLDSISNALPAATEWLRQDLQNNHSEWKFVVFHHPAYYAFDDGKTAICDSIRTNWIPVFEQNGVDMAFVGHQHVYMRTKPMRDNQVQADGQGIVYVMGVSGSKLYGAGPQYDYVAKEVANVSNYQIVNIDGDVMTLTSVKVNGDVIETYEINKNGPGAITISGVPATAGLIVGGAHSLSVTTDPADASVSYASGDEAVATVSSSGVITAVAPGDATITVTASKAGYTTATATCAVTVADTTTPAWAGGSQLTASVNGGNATLSWPAATDSVGVTGYRVYQNDALVDTVSGDTRSYTVTGLGTNITYTFKVEAGNAAGKWSANGPNYKIYILPENASGTVTITDADCYVPKYNDTVSGNVYSDPLPQISLTAHTSMSQTQVQVEIPAGATVTAPATWDGIIHKPSVSSAAISNATVSAAIEVGFSGGTLTFDKAVKLLIPGQAGKKVGYFSSDGTFNQISTVVEATYSEAAVAELAAKSALEGKQNDGDDLVIWTMHFTKFATYIQTAESPGGGGGGSVIYTTKAAIVTPSAGGTISLNSEATIEVPANALAGTSALEVKVQKTAAPPAVPAGFKLAGSVYEFSVGGENSYNFNRDVTIILSFDPAALSPGETPAIYYYDEAQGQWVNIGGSVSGNTVTVQVDHFTKFAVMGARETLNDIGGHWAVDNINHLIASGAINGYPDGSFKPDNTITRAEFAAVLVKAFKLVSQDGKTFTDTAGHWARDYIAAAADNGVVNGYDTGAFGPDDLITREQMAVMIVKAAKLTPVTGEAQFADNGSISGWASNAVVTAAQNGIMQGYPDNTIQPAGNATRGEAVTVIVKALSKIAE